MHYPMFHQGHSATGNARGPLSGASTSHRPLRVGTKKSWAVGLCAVLLAVTSAMAAPQTVHSTPSGPVVRSLGEDYFLVQCNACLPQVDEMVVISRAGREVGAGKVMRIQGGQCSIKLLGGVAVPGDCVELRRTVTTNDRGPELPSVNLARPTNSESRQSRPDGYWNSISGGRVLDLNSGRVSP